MDPYLANVVDHNTPKINPFLGNGLAYYHLQEVENYIDQVFKLAAKGFPEGLVYNGYKRCDPRQEFTERTRKRENKCVFDIARSDIYMVKYSFRYYDKDLPDIFLYLPYASEGGTITISGSLYTITPVLTDRVISIGVSSIFIMLLRGKVTFNRVQHRMFIDDVGASIPLSCGTIYNKTTRQSNFEVTTRAESLLAHYLFCKYGVRETFKKYANSTIYVGTDDINRTNYPVDDYVICSSMHQTADGARPRAFARIASKPNTIKIAIKRSEFNNMARQLVAGFYYLVDYFPDRIQVEYIDQTQLFKILLGHILISGKVNEGILLDEMDDHINSLDEYIDGPIALKLKDIGIDVINFYDLMAVVVDKFSDWIIEANENINSMYGKELSVLYYICYGITSMIFKMYFKLQATSRKKLTAEEIYNIMRKHLSPGLIFSITKQLTGVAASSYSGDNKTFKFTSMLVQQSDSNRLRSKKSRLVIEDPSKRLHVSVAEIGSYSNLPKSNPDGRSRINLFTTFDDKCVVQRNPEFVEFLDQIQQMIK